MAKFELNLAGLQAVTRQSQVLAQLRVLAGIVADHAKSIAPRDDDEDEHYADMIEPDAGVVDGLGRGRVNAFKWTSGFLEFGTDDTPVFATLRTAAESLGHLSGDNSAGAQE